MADRNLSQINLNILYGKLGESKKKIRVSVEVRDGTPSPPPPPPNSPEPQQHQQQVASSQVVSSETSRLVSYFDTLEEEDCLSAAERLERVNREPIPPNATRIPGGAESDEEEW